MDHFDSSSALTMLFSLLGGGASTMIIKSILDRKKNQSEVTSMNVKTAIELEQMAMSRYAEASQSLDQATRLLSDAKAELEAAKRELAHVKEEHNRELSKIKYDNEMLLLRCQLLEDLLTENGIVPPESTTIKNI